MMLLDIWQWFLNHELLWHEVWLTFVGLAIWWAISWRRFKSPYDKKHQKASAKQWWAEESDDIFLSLLVGCLIVMLDDEIMVALGVDGEKFHDAVYLLGGPAADILYELTSQFNVHKKKIVSWFVRKLKA